MAIDEMGYANDDRNTREQQEEQPKRYLKPAISRRHLGHAVLVRIASSRTPCFRPQWREALHTRSAVLGPIAAVVVGPPGENVAVAATVDGHIQRHEPPAARDLKSADFRCFDVARRQSAASYCEVSSDSSIAPFRSSVMSDG